MPREDLIGLPVMDRADRTTAADYTIDAVAGALMRGMSTIRDR